MGLALLMLTYFEGLIPFFWVHSVHGVVKYLGIAVAHAPIYFPPIALEENVQRIQGPPKASLRVSFN